MRIFRFQLVAIIAAIIVLANSCEKNDTDVNGIRPLVYLTTEDIPSFKGMTQTEVGRFPLSRPKDISENYSPKIEFRWFSDDENYANIEVWVDQSKESALNTLTSLHEFYTNPFFEDTKDDPPKVGDLSYAGGIEFIRDNLIVRIRTSDKFDEMITEIAKNIDTKIIQSPTFKSFDDVRPIIKSFTIENNPVLELSQTPIILNIEDPNNKKSIAIWYMNTILGHGGSILNYGIDSCYFIANSVYDDLETNEVEISVLVINEYGFWAKSDSALQITTIKK